MPLRVGEALHQARSAGVDRLDAQLLLCHVLQAAGAGISRSWLLAHDEHALTAPQQQAWQQLLQRRAAGEPLAYVTGEQLFCGLRLRVTPAVLIPRPETELLVQWALQCLQAQALPAPRVLDMGTGSGAVALAIKQALPQARVCASDISAAALQVARSNATRLGLDLQLAQADWWMPLAGPAPDGVNPATEAFDLIVSNPPYIAAGDAHLDALQHEPQGALVAAEDGLADLRAIIGGARQRLRPGGWLLLEHGHDQGPAVRQLLAAAGLQGPQTRSDLAGLDRCSGAKQVD